MNKRPRQGEPSGFYEKLKNASKRSRVQTPSKRPLVLNPSGRFRVDGLGPVAPISEIPVPVVTQDPQYYFEDGSVVLLVDNVLFKVHASLMKINSEVFRDMFALPSGNDGSNLEGASRERPISIPGVTSGEFRSLMMMIYCSPSDKLFLDMQARNKSRSGSFQNFTFYSDVARLANRFCMTDIENWAINQLRSLMFTSASHISNGARDQTKDGMPIIFTRTLQYARVIADTVLEHNVRNLNQRYCITPENLSAPVLLGLLHDPQLRQQDPSMFGFLFVALLNLGHSVWMKEPFTREDRVAFFSAQSFLTPLPESLGKELAVPLLVRPQPTKEGYPEVFKNKTCSERCQERLSIAWSVIFGLTYYKDVASRKASKATARLQRLPYRRLEFANMVRAYSACGGDCSSKALGWLDEGIHQLFVRLGGYYQSID